MRIAPKLTMFYVFDSRLGKKEGREHEKIMYFWPHDVHPIEFQSKTVGLSEAMINFAKTFTQKPCEFVHQQKHRVAFYEAEPDVWFVLEVQNPSFASQKDGTPTVVWCEEDLDDLLLQNTVMQIYKLFKLFNGSFKMISEKFDLDALKRKLNIFLPQLLGNLNLDQLDIFNTLDGINFMPVDKLIYLRIQNFINVAENTFSQIKFTSFLFQDHLVWSGLELDDMRVIYRSLSQIWSPEEKERNLKSPFPFSVNRTISNFVTGPENLDDADSPLNVPSVYISSQSEEYGLIIYQLRDVVCLFFIEASAIPDRLFYRTAHNFMSSQLQSLAVELAQKKQPSVEDPYRYLYFNHMNLALKTSLGKTNNLGRETLRLLNEMHFDFERMPESVSEIMVRTQGDGWIVGRKSDQRELYVIFDHRNDNLIEVNEEIKRFNSTYFGNIFID